MSEQQARDFATSLGVEIASWRRRKGLNRAQLGAMVGLSGTTIGRIERGEEAAKAATPAVWRIAIALGLSFSDLVRRAEVALDLSEALARSPRAGNAEADTEFVDDAEVLSPESGRVSDDR